MLGNRRIDTKPEVRLRSLLHRSGFRFRKDFKLSFEGGSVRPDVVFTRQRVVVFLDGCFWHRCPEHGHSPRSNTEYWQPKLQRNVERDRRIDARLAQVGWHVVRIWEHVSVDEAAEVVAKTLRSAVPRTVGKRPAMGRKVDVDSLVGSADIARRLGVKRPQVVHDWLRRYADFPEPVARVSQVRIWYWPDIEVWAQTTGRTAQATPFARKPPQRRR